MILTKPRANLNTDYALLEQYLEDKEINIDDIDQEDLVKKVKEAYDILSNKERQNALLKPYELPENFEMSEYFAVRNLAKEIEKQIPYDKYDNYLEKAIELINKLLNENPEKYGVTKSSNKEGDKEENDDGDEPGGKVGGKSSRKDKKGILKDVHDNIEKKVLDLLLKTQFKKLNNRNFKKLVESPQGEFLKVRSIADPSEILQANPEILANKDFMLRLAEENIDVTVNAISEQEDKRIILLLDASGSMSNGIKIKITNAILHHLINKCAEKKLKLLILPYDQEDYYKGEEIDIDYENITDDKKYQEIMNQLRRFDYGGGSTDVHNLIVKLQKEYNSSYTVAGIPIKESEVELLIITDGEDKTDNVELQWKTNTVLLGKENEGLINYSKLSKGISVFLPNQDSANFKNEIKTYDYSTY